MDEQEVERALKDTQRVAEELRAKDHTVEADKMDAMADQLEAALHEHHQAEDKKKDAEATTKAGDCSLHHKYHKYDSRTLSSHR